MSDDDFQALLGQLVELTNAPAAPNNQSAAVREPLEARRDQIAGSVWSAIGTNLPPGPEHQRNADAVKLIADAFAAGSAPAEARTNWAGAAIVIGVALVAAAGSAPIGALVVGDIVRRSRPAGRHRSRPAGRQESGSGGVDPRSQLTASPRHVRKYSNKPVSPTDNLESPTDSGPFTSPLDEDPDPGLDLDLR